MMPLKFSRRNLLRGSLAATATIPFLESTRALGQSDAPVRLLVIHTPNGTINSRFWPTMSGNTLSLAEITRPLEAYKDRLTFLKGIRLNDALQNGPLGGTVGSEHARGTGGMLTGRPLKSGTEFVSFGNTTSGWGSGISLDQHLATSLKPPTTFKSLQVGAQVVDTEVRARISYTGADQPVAPREKPADVFEALFANLAGGANSMDPGLERLRAQRKSVFDLTGNELTRIGQMVSSADKAKLDAHLTVMRAVEQRLTVAQMAGGEAGTCSPPTLADIDPADQNLYEEVGKLQMDLTAAAFACDQTRIATFQFSYSESEHLFPFLDLTGNHHGLSHEFNELDPYAKIQTWYAGQIAYFLSKLDSYVEGDRTLLDNTLVLWASEIGEASQHDLTLMPYVFAGSAGGQFPTGRLIDFAGNADANQMLVSMANLMGDEALTEFGDASGTKGPLPMLT
jgi:Protein of unknown function (DUF1552)